MRRKLFLKLQKLFFLMNIPFGKSSGNYFGQFRLDGCSQIAGELGKLAVGWPFVNGAIQIIMVAHRLRYRTFRAVF